MWCYSKYTSSLFCKRKIRKVRYLMNKCLLLMGCLSTLYLITNYCLIKNIKHTIMTLHVTCASFFVGNHAHFPKIYFLTDSQCTAARGGIVNLYILAFIYYSRRTYVLFLACLCGKVLKRLVASHHCNEY